jgi:hypothetical protein
MSSLRIEEKDGAPDLRCDLLEHLQPFRTKLVKPVVFRPGRARLSTKPLPTGSDMAVKQLARFISSKAGTNSSGARH